MSKNIDRKEKPKTNQPVKKETTQKSSQPIKKESKEQKKPVPKKSYFDEDSDSDVD